MKRSVWIPVFAVVGVVGCGGGATSSMTAQNVNVRRTPEVTFNNNTDTVCVSGDVAGLGHDDLLVDIDVVYTATTVCRNRGGNIAPGQGTVTFPVDSEPQVFTPDKNGRVRFTSCTTVPDASTIPLPTPQEAGCPNGNWEVLPITQGALSVLSYDVEISHRGETFFTASGP